MSSDAGQGILERRARLLARPLEQAPDGAVVDILVVQVGRDTRCGLDVASVRHIVHHHDLARLPGASRSLVGVTIIHGEAIPVADLAELLGLGEPRLRRPFLVVVGGSTSPVGLLVDHVADVLAVREDEIRPLSDAAEGSVGLHRGITPDGVVLLDSELLLEDARLVVPRAATSALSGLSPQRHPGAP